MSGKQDCKTNQVAQKRTILNRNRPAVAVQLSPETGEVIIRRLMSFVNPHPEPRAKARTVGRNQLCPCDSGLKFKYCCGRK
jgi:uncharacterized protein YecA (UPF0149 family)